MHVARTSIVIAISLMVAAFTLTSCKDGQFTELNFSGKQDLTWESLVANAKVSKDKGNIELAEAQYKEAAEKCVKSYGENDGRTATCIGYLAELYFDKQDWRVAYETYKRWIKILQEIEPNGETLKHAKDNYKKIKEKLKQYGLADEIKREQKEKKEQELKEQEAKELKEQEEKINEDVPKGRKRRVRTEVSDDDSEDSDSDEKDSKSTKGAKGSDDWEDSKPSKGSKSSKGDDWDDSKSSKKSEDSE